MEDVLCSVQEMADEEALIQLIIGNIQTENHPLEIGLNALHVVKKGSKQGLSTAAYGKRIGLVDETIRNYVKGATVYKYVFEHKKREIINREQTQTGLGLLPDDKTVEIEEEARAKTLKDLTKQTETFKLPETDWLWMNDFIVENECSKQQVIVIVKAIKDFRNAVKVAVIEYIGYSYVEISRLADIDNENDEYHTKVPITDVWKFIPE